MISKKKTKIISDENVIKVLKTLKEVENWITLSTEILVRNLKKAKYEVYVIEDALNGELLIDVGWS